MAGRGSFIESFPLFGYDLNDYDEPFAEKLELLLKLRESERVTWSGRHRASLDDAGVYPRPVQDPLPIWIAVGGTPQSVVRAAMLGLPLAIAIIGGQPERFAPLARLYREVASQAGHDPARLPISINSHAYVAQTSRQAGDEYFPASLRLAHPLQVSSGVGLLTRDAARRSLLRISWRLYKMGRKESMEADDAACGSRSGWGRRTRGWRARESRPSGDPARAARAPGLLSRAADRRE